MSSIFGSCNLRLAKIKNIVKNISNFNFMLLFRIVRPYVHAILINVILPPTHFYSIWASDSIE